MITNNYNILKRLQNFIIKNDLNNKPDIIESYRLIYAWLKKNKVQNIPDISTEEFESFVSYWFDRTDIDVKFKKFTKLSRQYDYVGNGSVKKVWNNGMGKLEFIMICPDDPNLLIINKCLLNKKDLARIKECFPEYELSFVEYGYPAYYNHSMYTIWKQ